MNNNFGQLGEKNVKYSPAASPLQIPLGLPLETLQEL
jgi:hypothetical protein